MSTPNVLVTGCCGYIGSVLVGQLLNAGCRVIGVDNLFYKNGYAVLPYLGHERFQFFRMDVQDTRNLAFLAEQCDVIIPLAAMVGAPICEKDEHHIRWATSINSWSITDLVESLSPNQRVIYPNTNSGYGQTEGDRYVTEHDLLAPISVYGKTKCEGEKAVLNHPNGVSLRLATVFGASPRMRMDLMVNDFTWRLFNIRHRLNLRESGKTIGTTKADVQLSIYEPHFKRNFVHVRDVCNAFLFMLGRHHLRGPYNLGLPTANLTKMELAHAICDILGLDRRVVVVGNGEDPDKRNYLVSNEKILSTGFLFKHTLEMGVREVETVCSTCSTQLGDMRNC